MAYSTSKNPLVNNPLAILWVGKANIFQYEETTDPETYQTTFQEVPIVLNEPCRLSHKRESTIDVNSGAPYVAQTIVLFIRPDLNIKEGSVIEITQNGVTNKYRRASKPAIYTHHQEVALELYEDHA